ncbi:unnamed protein product [Phytomonas sp. Hart1]|nr:unnamed protein product [Phytomonas sp. Hart1]|eukprot:CCW70971.1 unnamed protein product [Phytomonas sp. isolate Hart1]
MRPSRTLLEVRSLAVLLHHIAEGVVLPYRQACQPESPGAFAGVLPSGEKDANALFEHTLSEVHAVLRFFLGKGTFFGDWAAFYVARQTRWLLRPVGIYEEAFQRCVVARREALGRAQIISLGFQALVKLEKPLLPGLKEPAASVANLFAPTAPNPPIPTGGRGGQDRKPLPPPDVKRNGGSRSWDPPAMPRPGERKESRRDAPRSTRNGRRWEEPSEPRKRERPSEPVRSDDARKQSRRESSHERSRRHHSGRYSRRR